MIAARSGRALIAVAATAVASLGFASTADAALGDRTLKPGGRGHDVRVLQAWLNEVGVRAEVDGVFGKNTAQALRRFERREGLRVDGRLSRSEARTLRSRRRQARAADANGGAEAGAPAAKQKLAPKEAAPTNGRARLSSDGRTAVAPAGAPAAVVAMIEAGNKLTRKPYRYGGGHGKFEDTGYDCSGAVSYVLHAADLLASPLASGGLAGWGRAGRGDWVSVYAHGGHAYMVVAGLRFDTSGPGERGPRWRPEARSSAGFAVRHPAGL